MKALNQNEIENLAQLLSDALTGMQLQEVITFERGIALRFHHRGDYWLIVDLFNNAPVVLLFEKLCPVKKSSKPKPVSLFINAHICDLSLTSFKVKSEFGRVLILVFKNSTRTAFMEIRLIPKQANIIVHFDDKSIAWSKPQELTEQILLNNIYSEIRDFAQIHQEWLDSQSKIKKNSIDPKVEWEKKRQKDLEKKQKALFEIRKGLDDQKIEKWVEAGYWVKEHGLNQISEEMSQFVRFDQSLSWNIENCFQQAKTLMHKKEGAQVRVQTLEKEISNLLQAVYQEKAEKKRLDDIMDKTTAKGRKLYLESGSVAYLGKSAADNLKLLRQAKAWDYWLHLRDFPGAHAIIHRKKEVELNADEIESVAQWVAQETLSKKSILIGQKMAVVVAECRHVRPIKGDKLGRVTYHYPKTYFVTLGSV